jgi:predicted nucleotidyltransferase
VPIRYPRRRFLLDLPPDVTVMLDELRDALVARGGLVGLYVYGSLTTGDYSPASDIDVIAMLSTEPDESAVRELGALHAQVASARDPEAKLHCLYIGEGNAAEAEPLRTYWYGDRMTQWQMKLLTQTEVLAAGVALYGPWPPPGIKPVPVPLLQDAVRGEITGYWRRLARKRKLWRKDVVVDHGLVVLPRAEALLTNGDLITKSQAIERLADFGVPAALAREIRLRRDGETPELTPGRRRRRARTARRIARRGVRRLGRL